MAGVGESGGGRSPKRSMPTQEGDTNARARDRARGRERRKASDCGTIVSPPGKIVLEPKETRPASADCGKLPDDVLSSPAQRGTPDDNGAAPRVKGSPTQRPRSPHDPMHKLINWPCLSFVRRAGPKPQERLGAGEDQAIAEKHERTAKDDAQRKGRC